MRHQNWYPELWYLTLPELERLFISGPDPRAVHKKSRWIWFEFVAAGIASTGISGVDFLLQDTSLIDDIRTGAVMVGLYSAPSRGKERRRRIRDFLVRYLEHGNQHLVMESVDALRSLGFTSVHDQVVPLLHHPSPYVVGAVLRYLAGLFPEEAIPHLLKALESYEFPICDSAIDCLDEMGYVQALPQIRALMNREYWTTRQAATTATANLTELVEDAKRAARSDDED